MQKIFFLTKRIDEQKRKWYNDLVSSKTLVEYKSRGSNMSGLTVDETQILKEVCALFQIKDEFLAWERINSGHINVTYEVRFQSGKRYIVQKINTYVFKNPVEMMQNIVSVTEFIRKKMQTSGQEVGRRVLQYLQTVDGNYYVTLKDGSFWRCCHFIERSVSFLKTEDLSVIEEAGKAFGEFQTHLADFPVQDLHIVIPHFHNTVKRYEALYEAVKKDEANRLREVTDILEGYKKLESLATKPYRLYQEKFLPLRVTHNDTKTSNVLFDAETKKRLSVIDLDTVMPGLVAFDFGDAIRISASTAGEDEKDLSKIALDFDKYQALTRGFVKALNGRMTEAETSTLALGALAMTAECGARFLTDYLNGDKYFRIHYPDQNLARAKCHLVLANDMVSKLDKMQAIVDEYCR
ncbi:MAG: aminoglycoside phosphotransferase family protein [Clostridiales bacterium]|nr:aminoglycoside phosphotransferase family protein [Clostridiales bacterium]